MSARLFSLTWVALLGCALLAPAALAAPPQSFQEPGGSLTEFHLSGSNGYEVDLSYDENHVLSLRAAKEGTTVEYTRRGHPLGKEGVVAGFPGYGIVAVRFKGTELPRRGPRYSNCDGRGPTVQRGVVEGRIQFSADSGFTEVAAEGAPAQLTSWEAQRCHYVHRHRRPRAAVSLYANSEEDVDGPDASFSAVRFYPPLRPPEHRVEFRVESWSRQDRITIYRTVSVAAADSSLRMADPKKAPENVTVTPPAPFSGSATLQRTPESTLSWTGDLSVTFPGLAPIALVGPTFGAQICAFRGCFQQSAPDGF